MYPMEHIWTIVMLEICKHTFYAYLSRIWKMMQFTGFIRKVFATKILLSGKFSPFLTLHLFQTFNMPWRRGTARISRGLPIQISRLIRTTYSAIYWHLTTRLFQRINVAITSCLFLLLLCLLDLNLLFEIWEPAWQEATSPWLALGGAERLLLGKCWHLVSADWLPDAPKLPLHRLFRHPEYEMRGRVGLSMYLLIKWLAMPA